MKTSCILLFCAITIQGFACMAQERSEDVLVGQRIWRVPRLHMENGHLVYRDSVSLTGMTKEQLYDKASEWLRYNLKSGDIEMRIKDRKAGHIAGKGKIMYNQSVVANNNTQGIYFDYEVSVGNDGYAYRLSNITGIVAGKQIDYTAMYKEELDNGDKAGSRTHKDRYEMISDMNSFITLFIQGLKAAMAR